MAINTTSYDFRDNNSDVWHFTCYTNSQGTYYELTDVNHKVVASGLEMGMSFQEWVIQLIVGIIHEGDSDE